MRQPTRHAATALAVAATAVALGACGGSDKPGYCDHRDALSKDVQGLKDVNVGADGLSALRTQFDKIRTDAREVIDGVKGDYPDEIAAMQRSLDDLRTTVQSTSSSPSAQDIVSIGGGVSSLVGSVSAFVDATADSC